MGRVKSLHFNPEGFGKDDQLLVSNAAQLSLNFRKRRSTQVQPANRATSREHFLGEILLIAQLANLRPNDVLWFFSHAPISELDCAPCVFMMCSDFGASLLDTATPD